MKALKISCLLIFVLGSCLILAAQDVPEKVRAAFATQFPNATAVVWELESEQEWEADFKIKKTAYSSSYLQDGTWLETEYEIDEKDIPKKIRKALARSFPGYKLEESEKLETSTGVAYEFELENGDEEIEVLMALNGKVLKTHQENDDEN